MPSCHLLSVAATLAFNAANDPDRASPTPLGLRIAEGGGFTMSGMPDSTPMIQEQGKGVLDAKNDISALDR